MKKILLALYVLPSIACSDGVTANPPITLPLAVISGGTGVTTSTGTGNTVLSTRPTFGGGIATGSNVSDAAVFGTTASDSGVGIRLYGALTGYNWLISNNLFTGSSVEFTPSTTGGGTTFSTPVLKLSRLGNLTTSGLSYIAAVPTISSCGTSPSVDSNANNNSGTVTVGSVSATACTITFATAFASYNHCTISSQGVVTSLTYSYTLSAITVTATGLTGDKLDYSCNGV